MLIPGTISADPLHILLTARYLKRNEAKKVAPKEKRLPFLMDRFTGLLSPEI
jgi:hypothetical protein